MSEHRPLRTLVLLMMLTACRAQGPRTSGALTCPAGTSERIDGDVYGKLQGCHLPDGTLHGPTIEWSNGTRIEGRYERGRMHGTFVQRSSTGKILSEFTMDHGTGVAEYRWDNGRLFARGAFADGARDGTWTYFHADGSWALTEVHAKGKLVESKGQHPHAAPLDTVDHCPNEPSSADDGCPDLPADAAADG